MNNVMLWMHSEARQCRPSAFTMNALAARYPRGVRFRVKQDVVNLFAGTRTFFRPVIEIVMEIKGRMTWVVYMWLDHEELEPIKLSKERNERGNQA